MKDQLMSLIQSSRKLINKYGFDICKIGKDRLGRNHEADLRFLVPETGVIFDIGANTGRAARIFTKLFPSQEVWSFEPCFETYNQLVAAQDLQNVRSFNLAFGSRQGEDILHKFAGSELNSLLSKAAHAESFIDPASIQTLGSEMIKLDTVDRFCAEHEIEQIAFMKIDTQGFELEVLKGSRAMLEKRQVFLIQCEVNFSDLYEGQPSLSALFGFMQDFNYGFIGMYDVSRTTDGLVKWCDLIFKVPIVE